MTADLGELERLARAADDQSELKAAVAATVPGWDKRDTAYNDAVQAHHSRQNAFRAAANPAAILALISRVRAAEGALTTVERILANIPKPRFDEGSLSWCVSDDVPEDIYTALSFAREALKATTASAVGMSEANETKPLSHTMGEGG